MNPFAIIKQLTSTGKAFKENEPGSREALIAQSRALVAALEIPSEFIQRTLWAEVRRRVPDTNLSQYRNNQANSYIHRYNSPPSPP